MQIDLYAVGGCMTCGGKEHIFQFLTRLKEKYGFTLNTYDTQIANHRLTAETFRNSLPLGQFYFPLVVINGEAKVTGYKPLEIEAAIKEML